MIEINNVVELLKVLPKTNCKKCGVMTCLLFSSLVLKGEKQVNECPLIDPALLNNLNVGAPAYKGAGEQVLETMAKLKDKIKNISLPLAAERIGAIFENEKLTIRVLGKNFSINLWGEFISDIHIHEWVVGPVIDYVLNGQGVTPSGEWVNFRELDRGFEWEKFFKRQCEDPLKRIADIYTDLFEDMIKLFNGKEAKSSFDADISIVILPLPRVPILICYLKSEDDLDSTLSIFFDSTTNDNINTESAYTIGTGLTRMFRKIVLRHGIYL